MSAFSVFGNPIKHSKSPQVYSIFAKQYGISQIYTRILAFWMNFDFLFKSFFDLGGIGANITMPFKERAFFLCDKVTSRASLASSVNTVKKEDGILLGDNTDGVGLLTDLNRLKWFKNKNNNKKTGKRIKVLLLGAGGAARGIIPPLLNFGCRIDIINRTFLRAQRLVDQYKHLGEISFIDYVNNKTITANVYDSIKYDIIINATTSVWVDNQIFMFPVDIIAGSLCYDMSYSFKRGELTPFLSLCEKHGALQCVDGLGMLIGQAAHSFLFWHGVFPCINSVLNKIG